MKRVLVVEDDREVNSLICRYLGLRNYQCVGAMSAEQCLAALDGPDMPDLPDLILMDLELPDMDGAALCARIRTRPEAREIPVIVMTGYQQEHRLERFRECGIAAYIFKPFSPRELLARVNDMLATPQGA